MVGEWRNEQAEFFQLRGRAHELIMSDQRHIPLIFIHGTLSSISFMMLGTTLLVMSPRVIIER